jgi:hypothetical protein
LSGYQQPPPREVLAVVVQQLVLRPSELGVLVVLVWRHQ